MAAAACSRERTRTQTFGNAADPFLPAPLIARHRGHDTFNRRQFDAVAAAI